MRPAETYRGARRNTCFNGHKVWSSVFYYDGHKQAARHRRHKKAMQTTTPGASTTTILTPKSAPQPALRLRRSARGQ